MNRNKINVTKSELSRLAKSEPGRRRCYYDINTPGLELRVTDSGTKSFSVYKWINGKNHRIVLGRFNPDAIQTPDFQKDPLSVLANNPGLSIEQARVLAVAVMMELALGNNPLAARKKKDGITLGELFKEYLHGYAIDHCKTWKVIEECFYRYLDH